MTPERQAASPEPEAARPRDTVASYGLSRPELADVHQALERVYGSQTPALWTMLLARANLTGHETDQAARERLLAVLQAGDPVAALCAASVTVRATAFDHLSAVHVIIRTADSAGSVE